jgi:hypothetical protein
MIAVKSSIPVRSPAQYPVCLRNLHDVPASTCIMSLTRWEWN